MLGTQGTPVMSAIIVGSVLLALCLTPPTSAAPADVDRTFGVDGLAEVPGSADEVLTGQAVLPDGRVYLATRVFGESIRVRRLLRDGAADQSFGDAGVVLLAGEYDDALVAVDPRRSLLYVAGAPSGASVSVSEVWRLRLDGSLDPRWGEGGRVSIDSATPVDMVARPQGGVVVSALTDSAGIVVALDGGGAPDSAFGREGRRILPRPADQAMPLAQLADGRLVTAMQLPGSLEVRRLLPDGAPDPSFSGDGVAAHVPPGELALNTTAMAVRPSGAVILAYNTRVGDRRPLHVAQLAAGGGWDPRFPSRTLPLEAVSEEEIALQPNGKALLAAATTPHLPAVIRLDVKGSPDRGFSGDGIWQPPRHSLVRFVDTQPTGRILVAADPGDPEAALVYALTGDKVRMCAGRLATIMGTPAADRLVGTAGSDVIAGLGGADSVRGREGSDVVCGGPGADVVRGGPGRDRLFGGLGDDLVTGGRHRDRLAGGLAPDELRGGPGPDRLFGSSGKDRLFGGFGNDRLTGGPHRDRLVGGPGRDHRLQ